MSRTILHMLLGVLLWVVFGYYWHIVMQRPITSETRHALIMVGSIVGVIVLFDSLWVLHNLRIARHTRRRARPADVSAPSRDFLGRSFIAQSDEGIRRARYIEVHVIDIEDVAHESTGHKLFRVTELSPGGAPEP